MFNLKVKTNKNPPIPFNGKVSAESSLRELQKALHEVTSIPIDRQKILIGFPPHRVTGSQEDTLQKLGLQNGEVIIVEESSSSSPYKILETRKSTPDASYMDSVHSSFPHGTLLKKVVPSDNSCLFTSIYFLVNGGEIDENHANSMRGIISSTIREHPHIYNEALLEKANADYCLWILKSTSWGGAIELSILSDYYQIEIVALDAKTGLMNRFGEDKKYVQRIFLMYDGIHYDPLYLETYDGRQLFIFPSSEEWLLDQASDLVRASKNAGLYTDTNKFRLVCNDCGSIMHGEEAALHHAKTSSHTNFAEVKENI